MGLGMKKLAQANGGVLLRMIPIQILNLDHRKKPCVAKERETKLEDTISSLQEKHGNKYTHMQYRIWSEMYLGGYHKSFEDPPTNTMFCRAGGSTTEKKKHATIVETFTEVAKNLTSALSPATSSQSTGIRTSPARMIESRSRCYKQLSDLNTLKTSGVLSEEEYKKEKDCIMTSLHKL